MQHFTRACGELQANQSTVRYMHVFFTSAFEHQHPQACGNPLVRHICVFFFFRGKLLLHFTGTPKPLKAELSLCFIKQAVEKPPAFRIEISVSKRAH
jgi:hypothetical protein